MYLALYQWTKLGGTSVSFRGSFRQGISKNASYEELDLRSPEFLVIQLFDGQPQSSVWNLDMPPNC